MLRSLDAQVSAKGALDYLMSACESARQSGQFPDVDRAEELLRCLVRAHELRKLAINSPSFDGALFRDVMLEYLRAEYIEDGKSSGK